MHFQASVLVMGASDLWHGNINCIIFIDYLSETKQHAVNDLFFVSDLIHNASLHVRVSISPKV
jgi:hypothetical protein